MANNFKIDASEVFAKLNAFGSKFDAALYLFANNGAQKMEQYAKQNRPWTDRTARARQSLTGSAFRVENGYRLQIAHGVSYGVFLEYAHERRFAILEPTVRSVGYGQIMPAFERFIERTCQV